MIGWFYVFVLVDFLFGEIEIEILIFINIFLEFFMVFD